VAGRLHLPLGGAGLLLVVVVGQAGVPVDGVGGPAGDAREHPVGEAAGLEGCLEGRAALAGHPVAEGGALGAEGVHPGVPTRQSQLLELGQQVLVEAELGRVMMDGIIGWVGVGVLTSGSRPLGP
jgi:hypothetical protein